MSHDHAKTRRLRVVPAAPRRPRCLVTNVHPERGLSRALCQHLGAVLRDIDFTLREAGEPDLVWICGYGPEALERLRELRRRHPRARIVVTGARGGVDWRPGALRAGADRASEWPMSPASLSRFLTAPPASGVSAAG